MMMSRACPALLFLLSVVGGGAACGPGVVTPEGTPPAPLFAVRVAATGTLTSTAPLRAALAWSVYSPQLLACLDDIDVDGVLTFDDATLEADQQTAIALQRCVVFSDEGRVETASVALEASFPLTLEIPVVTVPDIDLLSGDDGARLGIADVLIYEDTDGDDTFDETARGASAFADVVRGTSRAVDEDALQESFVVYREGELSAVWKIFRAIYGCADPAPGFSTVTIGVDVDTDVYFCTVDDSEVPVALRDDIAALGCAPRSAGSEPVRADSVDGIPADAVAICEAAEDGGYDVVYSTNFDSVCADTTTLALVGCDTSSEARCRATFFDLRGDEPSWWPCRFEDGEIPRFSFETAPTLSSGTDLLFTVDYFSGLATYGADVRAELDQPDGTTTDDLAVVVNDNDDNGRLNAGDTIAVSERGDRFDEGTPAGNWPARLVVDGVVIAFGQWVPPVPLPTPPALTFSAVDAASPITTGTDDLFVVTWEGGDAGPFAIEDVRISALLGGEWPLGGSGRDGVLVLVDDIDDDGRFGRGDSLLVRERDDGQNAIDQELLSSFTNVVSLGVEIPIGFRLTGSAGGAEVEIR